MSLFFENLMQCILMILIPSVPLAYSQFNTNLPSLPVPLNFILFFFFLITHSLQFVLPIYILLGVRHYQSMVMLPGATSFNKILSLPQKPSSVHNSSVRSGYLCYTGEWLDLYRQLQLLGAHD